MNKKSEKNLPLYGIGPVIVFGQLLIAGGEISILYKLLKLPISQMGLVP